MFEAFFLDTSIIARIVLVIDFFGSLMVGKSIVKLFLTFCKSHQGFTRQPVNRNVHNWHRRFKTPPKFHEKTPRERERKSENGGGRGKQGRNFGRSGGGGVPRGAPKAGVQKGGAPKSGAPRKLGCPKFRVFSPTPATIFILSSSLGCRFVEFWWCE